VIRQTWPEPLTGHGPGTGVRTAADLADELEALRLIADGLGITVDRRWGTVRLREAIEKVELWDARQQLEPPR
jgi:hypothetical protein